MNNCVLFVDDDPGVGRVFSKMAQRMGYVVDWVGGGLEAIERVRKQYYPLIVTDVNMPDLDGLALLECLRALSPDSVTLLITGDPEVELPDPTAEDCSLAGILSKPLSYEELEVALADAKKMAVARKAKNGGPRQVLLVDGNGLDAQLTTVRLKRDLPGVEVRAVSSIRDAQNRYCDNEFDLVVTDLALPDARGVEAVAMLHQLYPNSAIVVLASDKNENLALQALKRGAQDYLLKDRVDGPAFKRAIRYAIERKTSERDLLKLAYYDQLTGLANRQLFQDRLVQALARVNRNKGALSVVFLDLDGFKQVNDTLGHEVGDKLLKVISNRLLQCVRQTDTVARLGGDEFAILFEGAPEHEVTRLACRLIETVSQPLELAGERVCVGASLGASAYPKHGFTADGLVRAADNAMYKSKQGGKGRLSWAGEDTNVHAMKRLRLESELRDALGKGQFELHYQPQMCPRNGSTCSVEAFIRWRDPRGEVIGPNSFLPMLHEMGLMPKVGAWVVKNACKEAARWANKDWRVAVNVDAQQLNMDLLTVVDEALAASGLAAERLELEVTEKDILKNSEQAATLLDALRERGVRIILDDFGTGYSSLAYLKRFPVQGVKLDGAFLVGHCDNRVIQAVIELVHALQLSVVAEGVETKEQFDSLAQQGCDLVQGYYLARPMGDEQLRMWNYSSTCLAS